MHLDNIDFLTPMSHILAIVYLHEDHIQFSIIIYCIYGKSEKTKPGHY